MNRSDPAVLAEDLHKTYGDTAALAGFDLEVPAGTVHGLLGPNGAGKTTAVRVLATLTQPDSGTARVAGFDAVRDPIRVRRRIGLVGQQAAVDEILTGRQNLVLFGRLYHLGAAAAARRADELLERFGLTEAAGRAAGQYSGGMRRRLDLAASLILSPAVLFLDEPTTGLDPRARTEVWESVRQLAAAGTTILLTTQYLDEADQLAGRISVVDHGRVIAEGSPDELKRRIGTDRLDVVVRHAADLPAVARLVGGVASGAAESDRDRRRVSAPVRDGMAALTTLVRALDDEGIEAVDVGLRRPSLDEVFLRLTGENKDKEVAA
ncbi:ABC-2 type transport system ATP-binding protein [Prauserella shujinwangii]|uniref:ABC-2 type transport system ATP-binding protein n=1 Tax=Prauserella shujinwangii TaxID=1453103 RepID=A0A2T0LZZ4_9PSEU|nr:ATP-binding cassette domain-containing protein [Prauserella shujinwangii]PRX49897.1 ABC-2 type transport system ATP-binding protein [Prauserella shujinwangii]